MWQKVIWNHEIIDFDREKKRKEKNLQQFVLFIYS